MICLCKIEEGKKCRRMSTCDHMFHRDCIDRWLTMDWWFIVNSSCPLCRAAICVVV
ncbi:hypothetical protein Csa_019978 [Cucumis sativus]|nr:hypothetical protein Csa_019978 [Cucumis sativus]